ncbi:carbonic anhydrase family protein [Paludisphaera rhizosphaerae]|uniref:carbonic anhydrase family protein n=1 Tax=Paludisphaera rhizosphaerae TaxID=2711216 RepID=UPI0013ED3E01|nr:carbonic anhydrase family protein [Paludisphaera rhizosphaerae]
MKTRTYGACEPGRKCRGAYEPTVEALDRRVVLNASTVTSWAAALHGGAATSTLSGQVTNAATGRPLGRVPIQLVDANGQVEWTVLTGPRGRYSFRVHDKGAYVVRAVAPRNGVQVAPTFTNAVPTGSMEPGFDRSSWNYRTGNSDPSKGPVGPTSWWTVASAGTLPFQSPINIVGPTTDLSRVLNVSYAAAAPTSMTNTGSQLQLNFPGATAANPDTITLAGRTFSLTEFHFHDPSENQVDGHTYNMEVHFVNTSAEGGATVLAVFLQLGAHNDALDPILAAATEHLSETPAGTSTPGSNVGVLDFSKLLPTDMTGWYFQGSLTTPPLAQPLNWMVFATPITLDFAQLQEYETLADGNDFLPNARPVQPTDGRQLNEINYDVNFQGQSIAGLNFSFAPRNS